MIWRDKERENYNDNGSGMLDGPLIYNFIALGKFPRVWQISCIFFIFIVFAALRIPFMVFVGYELMQLM